LIITLIVNGSFARKLKKRRHNKDNAGFSTSGTLEHTKSKEWMSKISDSKLISALSIPGTHESATYKVKPKNKIIGTPFIGQAKCHAMDIPTQLDAGIRFFDIRVANNGDIIHGKGQTQFKTEYTFDNILNLFTSFLKDHSSETIIMKIKNEEGKGKRNDDFIAMFESKITGDVKKLMKYNTDIPTMGEIRGHIWLFDDFEYSKGFPTSHSKIIKQNDWKAGWIKPGKVKAEKVKQHFEAAEGKQDSGNLYINNLSANAAAKGNLFVTPEDLASEVNSVTLEHKSFLGIVACDFPSQKLIDHVIAQNFAKRRKH